jgi:DNA-binding HxlR family transcriptional regulator
MTTRSYNQFCALAYALDVIGERWTLLIVRELLTGPRRFTDLQNGLPGISTNLLAERLKGLEQAGLLRRRVLPPPAGSTVYELTPVGQALEEPLLALGRWGVQFLPGSLEGVALPSVGVMALAIKAMFRPEQAAGVRETYTFQIDDELLQVQVQDGALSVQQGEPHPTDVRVTLTMPVYWRLFAGQLAPEAALAEGLVCIDGDPDALHRFLAIWGVPTAV